MQSGIFSKTYNLLKMTDGNFLHQKDKNMAESSCSCTNQSYLENMADNTKYMADIAK